MLRSFQDRPEPLSAMYTRDNPSPDYRAMVQIYETLHTAGEQGEGKRAEDTFPGKMLLGHAREIKRLVDRTGARDLLDYGAGKGVAYAARDLRIDDRLTVTSLQDYWGVDEIRCYDPGHAPFSALPERAYDAVISTDVLEHVNEPDVPWVVEEMFAYAGKFVCANVACYPAVKHLPDGRNAHCTLHPPEWWAGLVHAVAMRHTDISYRFVMTSKTGPRKKLGLSRKRRKVNHVVERVR